MHTNLHCYGTDVILYSYEKSAFIKMKTLIPLPGSSAATSHSHEGPYPKRVPTTKQLPHPLNCNSGHLQSLQLHIHHIWASSPFPLHPGGH